ncbi:MAG: hypothetical protein U0Z44_01495 [Kouleothrix sp.]
MACGAPVLCSHSSSLPEVVGGAALLAEPTAGALAAGWRACLATAGCAGGSARPGRRAPRSSRGGLPPKATVAAYERAATHAA